MHNKDLRGQIFIAFSKNTDAKTLHNELATLISNFLAFKQNNFTYNYATSVYDYHIYDKHASSVHNQLINMLNKLSVTSSSIENNDNPITRMNRHSESIKSLLTQQQPEYKKSASITFCQKALVDTIELIRQPGLANIISASCKINKKIETEIAKKTTTINVYGPSYIAEEEKININPARLGLIYSTLQYIELINTHLDTLNPDSNNESHNKMRQTFKQVSSRLKMKAHSSTDRADQTALKTLKNDIKQIRGLANNQLLKSKSFRENELEIIFNTSISSYKTAQKKASADNLQPFCSQLVKNLQKQKFDLQDLTPCFTGLLASTLLELNLPIISLPPKKKNSTYENCINDSIKLIKGDKGKALTAAHTKLNNEINAIECYSRKSLPPLSIKKKKITQTVNTVRNETKKYFKAAYSCLDPKQGREHLAAKASAFKKGSFDAIKKALPILDTQRHLHRKLFRALTTLVMGICSLSYALFKLYKKSRKTTGGYGSFFLGYTTSAREALSLRKSIGETTLQVNTTLFGTA